MEATLTGKVDFSDLVFTIGNTPIRYGNFITAFVNFLIIAFSIFLVLKYINRFHKQMENIKLGKIVPGFNKKSKSDETVPVAEPTVKICPYCYSEINIKATKCPHCTSELNEQ